MEIVPILQISPFPILDLNQVEKPKDGLYLSLNNYCGKKFTSKSTCQDFYKSLANQPNGFHACPFGFTCFKFSIGTKIFAFTSFVPYPRQGNDLESQRAKDHTQTKVARDSVERAAAALLGAEKLAQSQYQEELKKYPAAFHEVIKLNGAVKQRAELLLGEDQDNEHAKTIFSSAELMSSQFEILELIANQELTKLPVKNRSTLKKLIFKCLKIYEAKAAIKGIRFEKYLADGDIIVCDKTFPIVPTVLIDNAIRYSKENSRILVEVINQNGYCELRVSNHCNSIIDQKKLFQQRCHGKARSEGSGNGLYLAQLVANQHHTQLLFDQLPNKDAVFSIKLKLVP